MKIKVVYMDHDRTYASKLMEYIDRNYSETINISLRNPQEISEICSSDCDVLLLGTPKLYGEKELGFKTVILQDAEYEKADTTENGNRVVHVYRYQKFEKIISSIERIFNAENEIKNMDQIKSYVIENYDLAKLSNEQLKEIISKTIEEKRDKLYISKSSKESLKNQVYSSIRGLGILDNILDDEDVTEVMINDYNRIFVEKSGCLKKYEGPFFESREQLEDIIQKIVGKTGREVNKGNPIVDTRLEDGSRVNVVLSPISLHGHAMTIRRFSKEPMNVERLIRYGSLTEEVAHKLECLVKAGYNIVVSGGTGSGKTTFLNALSNFIPKDERLITIEDSAELQIVGIDNLISLETRNANSAGAGEITIRELIKSSLRMRPDRIVVGEVRGEEALDMLQAMNTGHDGSLSTAHANSSMDLISRLSTMVLQGAAGLPLEAIKQQIASAVDIIIHLSRLRDHSRKVMEISEVAGYENGEVVLNPLYVFEEFSDFGNDKVEGFLNRTVNPLIHTAKLEAAGIREII